eukprot:jgi/Tetstr1/457309/TSEL_043914.t1
MRMGSSPRHDAEYYLYIKKAPPSIVAGDICASDPRSPDHSFPNMNLKTILIDNQKTQIGGMKSMMKAWFKEKPWDETQRLRPDDFEEWPGLPPPMTVAEEQEERAAAEKRRLQAAD